MATKGSFAKRTTVPVEKSLMEIRRVLDRYGATETSITLVGGKKGLSFKMRDSLAGWRGVRVTIAESALESQTERQQWRALVMLLRAKLESIALNVTTFEQEFLPYIQLSETRTVGDVIIPQMRAGELRS